MYREDLIVQILNGSTDRDDLLSEFYFANLGLVVQMCKDVSWMQGYYYDLMQLAYVAMDTAFKCYDESKGFSFLSYFRMCFKHECYVLWRKSGMAKEFCFGSGQAPSKVSGFDVLEVSFMYKWFWECIQGVLSDRDYFIIRQRFVYNRTLKYIAGRTGLSIEGVRKALNRSYSDLRVNKNVIEVAGYFGYRVAYNDDGGKL